MTLCSSRLFVACVLIFASFAFAADQRRTPNVVLIVADDLGYGDLGCYGQMKIRTPRLDQMAREGARFTQFYSGSPVCAPSRCVLLTGKHAGHAAIRDNRELKPEGQFPLPEAELTIAELLKTRSYATGAVGKWGLGTYANSGSPLSQGFDSFFGYLCQRRAHNHFPDWLWRNKEKLDLFDESATKEQGVPGEGLFDAFEKFGETYAGDLFEKEAIAFLKQHHKEPFFLYLPITAPHLALQVPEDSLREYEDKWEDPPYKGGQGYLPHKTPRAAYAAMVTRLDRMVGRVLDELDELGIADETLVIFTSDNGPAPKNTGGAESEFFGSSGGLRGLKGSAYEGGIRVPCLVRWPGVIAGDRIVEEPLAFCDVLPTLCELAGAAIPGGVDGLSFLPLLTGKGKQQQHDFLYWEFASYEGYQAVRMGDFKAIRPQLKKGEKRIELYDLAHDPKESHDLAGERRDVVERAEKIMKDEHVPAADFPLPGIDPPKENGK